IQRPGSGATWAPSRRGRRPSATSGPCSTSSTASHRPMARRVVILGGGIAGATAATTLRGIGFDGQIELFGAEIEHPYHRPPLSKGYLRGEVARSAHPVEPPRSYEDLGIEVRLGVAVTAINPARKVVKLSSGETPYDHLVVATGARSRALAVPG